MNKRLLALGAGIIVTLALGIWFYDVAVAPIDDPTYFCDAAYRSMHPDQGPVSSPNATVILRNCPEPRTVTLAQGQTVAVDLVAFECGVDSNTKWDDLMVSNDQVLSTIKAPARVRVPAQASNVLPCRLDEVAVYRAARSGEATLNAVEHFCGGGLMGGCDQGHRWTVTVRVG